MRYIRERAADDWELLEIVVGEKRPCSDAYSRAAMKDWIHIFRELRLLKAAGCPPDRLLGNPEVDAWKQQCKGDHHKSIFYVLKAKPSGWRLYFFVPDESKKQIIFLLAVNKKKDERNQEDFQKLCKAADRIRDRGASTERLFIPDR